MQNYTFGKKLHIQEAKISAPECEITHPECEKKTLVMTSANIGTFLWMAPEMQ